MNASDTSAARAAAVAASLGRIHAIADNEGITRASLARIQGELEGLAQQSSLFPMAEFHPPPKGEKTSCRYLLHEDPDGGFALYLLSTNPGNESKPHDHTTWAVIAAVEGQEHNQVYRRTDEGGREGAAMLEQVREVVVEPGTSIAFMPDDIHAIRTVGTHPTRHLHLYGLALERLDERVGYDLEAGTVQPYNKAFMQPTVNR
ncbi:MAG: cysteine dioxygenase family protein [Acetobacteraceae bacterium]|nr:cysteine dioxygenase family protein [Acetobacteraceae bacterium]